MVQVTLDSALDRVVGARTAKPLLKAFGIETVGDLLMHLPRRYSRRGELTPLRGLPIGEQATVIAQVLDVNERRMQRRNGSLLTARITDGDGFLTLTYFNQAWRLRDLRPGARGFFSGKVSEYRGALQLQHPDYEMFDADTEVPGADRLSDAAAKAWAETPVPIYPATAQVPSWVTAKAVALVLDALGPVPDPIPDEIVWSEGILPLGEALESAHRPQHTADWQAAQRSLRFREAFELQVALLARRRQSGLEESVPRPAGGKLLARFDAALPFELTGDQTRASATIAGELAAPHPMHRLLQGEVGSGKTLVALRAMLQVAESSGQSAFLAPTEVLAAQHFRSVVDALGPDLAAELNPVLLTGSMPAAERKRALLSLASGTSRIAIGTHALLSDNVTFFDLGLVVVDEQHRFGVEQREALRRKGVSPHVLAMTATPIPRTVALTAFGDLEVTTIRELPAGRQGIETFVVPELEMPAREARVWARMAEDVAEGRQVYVVCPAISAKAGAEEGLESEGAEAEGDARELANVEQTVTELRERFPGAEIAGLTGAMSASEKERAMAEFTAARVMILVATTVIEVGVNVPNATIMVVRDADRFGISQLHQLRGRVGRGQHAGLCLLMTRAEQGTTARARLDAVAASSDGFVLAEADLELRREGNILGTAQSGGKSALKLLRVTEHGELIERARELAGALLERDPELKTAPLLAAQLAEAARQRDLDNLAKS